MNNLQRRRIKVIKYTVISVVIAATLLLLMFNSGIKAFENISGVVINPVIKGADYVFENVGDFFASFTSRLRLKNELAAAQEKLIQLENIQSVSDEVKAENQQLLALLNEKETYPQFEYKYAKVIAKSIDDYSATYTLNKGEKDGIKTDMVVVASGGLAGKIVKTTESTSILLAVIDSRCGVPALAEESRDTGVVKGISNAGTTAGSCNMSALPTNALIKPGDTVITSGMGDVFPKGIKIGKITEVSEGGTGQINTSARVTPSVDFDHLENVLIIVNNGE